MLSDKEIRHLLATVESLELALGQLGTISRRLHRGVKHARFHLERWAEVTRIQARQSGASSADGWPQDAGAFGHAVAVARRLVKYTRPKLAALVGVSDGTIANIEKGKRCRADIRIAVVQAFARLEDGIKREGSER